MTEVKKSFCHLCLAECGINVTVENNRFIKIVPNFNDVVSNGYICEKSQRLPEYQHSSDRITSPLKKIDGVFVAISWDQAINEIRDEINTAKNKLYMAPLSPMYNASTLYSYELMKKLHVENMCNVLSVEKMYSVLASSIHHGAEPDRQHAQTLIVIGQNPWVTQHYPQARKILNDIKNNPERTLIVIDPCQTETTKIATHHMQLLAGTDSWLLRAIIKLIIDNGKIDYEFVDKHTINFEDVIEYFSALTISECLTNCNQTYDAVNKIVEIITNSESVAIDFGNGICHSVDPEINNYLITLIYMLTGNYQKKGTMVNYHGFLSRPHYFTAVTPSTEIKPGQFDCFIIDNNNPASRYPNSANFINALSSATVIVLDSFMSVTAKLANYVLPTATFFERYECVNSNHPHNETLQLSEPVLSEYRTANDIYELILNESSTTEDWFVQLYSEDKIKFYDTLHARYENKVPDVYRILSKTLAKQYKNVILAIVWWDLFQQHKWTHNTVDSILHASILVDRLNTVGVIKLSANNNNRQLIDLSAGKYLKKLFQVAPYSKFEYILQCGYRQKTSVNQVLQSNAGPSLEIGPTVFNALQLTDSELIEVESSTGILTIKCMLNLTLPDNLLRIANNAIINILTDIDNEDYLSPQYKLVSVNIRKINGNSKHNSV